MAPGGKIICLHCKRPGFDPWVWKIPQRREWLPTPIFLPGEFHGQRSLAGYSLWDLKESDTTEQLTLGLHFQNIKNSFFSSYSKTGSSWILSVGHNFPTFAFNKVNIEQKRRVKKIGQNNFLSPNLACYKISYQEFILKNKRKHICLPNFF